VNVRDFFAMPWESVKNIPMPPSTAYAVAMQQVAKEFIEQYTAHGSPPLFAKNPDPG
jgi:hypothetical protein